MKKTVAILLIALLAMSALACSKNPLVGTWAVDIDEELAGISEEERAEMESLGFSKDKWKWELTFKADGTGCHEEMIDCLSTVTDFTYTVKDGKLTIRGPFDGEIQESTSKYEIKGNVLTIYDEDGLSITYYKRK